MTKIYQEIAKNEQITACNQVISGSPDSEIEEDDVPVGVDSFRQQCFRLRH
jgi:hypothetical protein